MKHKIILDCDPGHDDAIAILLAGHHPDIELMAITTVAGNQSTDKTTRNALKVCSLAGLNTMPIARGMDRPHVLRAKHAENIHGVSGLDGPDIPEATIEPIKKHAVDLLIELLSLASKSVIDRLRSSYSQVPVVVADLFEFFGKTYKKNFGFPAPPVHDPCAVAAVIDPTMIKSHMMHVEVETAGEWTVGRTVCDVYGKLGKEPNARVGYSLEVERFWDMVISTILTYDL